MADNITLNLGSGGDTLAAEDVTSVKYQRIKLVDGSAAGTTGVAVGGGVEAAALRVTLANDSTGVVSVDDNGAALTVDNGGTFVVQENGAALTALQLLDDIVATDDTSTHATGSTKGAVIMAAATPTDSAVEANDLGAVAMSTDRRLHVDAQIVGQDADVTIADGGNSITVDNSGVFAVQASQASAASLNAQVVGDVASAASDSGNPVKVGAVFNTTQPTVTTGQRVNLQATNRGALIVGTGVTNLGTNIAQMNGVTVSMGNGASGTGVQRVTLASDSTGTVAATQSGTWNVNNVSGTISLPTGAATAANQTTGNTHLSTIAGAVSGVEMQVDVVAALPAGTNAIGKLAANSGVDIGDVDVTSISPGSNLIGDVGLGVRTSGGMTPYYNTGTASLTQVKASAGQIYFIHCMNLTASVKYLQLFNVANGSITLGTTTPTNEFALPTQGDTNGAGFAVALPIPLAYGTAINFAITTTKSGATPASANECLLNLGYA